MDWSLLRPSFPKEFDRTSNQEGPTVFDTYKQYTLWDSVCNHSINPYFNIFTEYKYLVKEDDE